MKIETLVQMKPTDVAVLHFEAIELIALMWAVEFAVGVVPSDDITEQAWAAHSRLQEAFKALNDQISRRAQND
jgi:hypothetical protein